MVLHRLLTGETLDQLINQVDREKHLLFYSYLTQRRGKAQFIGQYVDDHLTAVLAYISELSFPAFSFYCIEREEVLFPELIMFAREAYRLNDHVTCGTILCEHDLQLFQSYGLITGTPQRFLTMKHVDQEKLLASHRAEDVKVEEYDEVVHFLQNEGMRFFTKSEIERFPFLVIKDGKNFIAVGGFHFYDAQLVEIGNIVTRQAYRGKGLGKLLTSQLTRLGKQRSTDVYLGVLSENEPAVNVYKGLGYETTAERSIVDFKLKPNYKCHSSAN
ncbi:GNAT family N-acetyltransferase [Salipaludibacillus agaradhaerens]|uniref:GNAT family N-acetyltransferase n=1 Tax=Salipaludibacillus agaradhaerens TaxID=76935 RepID=UPI0009963B96|nr:GNAT family N-acetyltransferase [Salipaludibacillus agaradhaerens]